MLVRTKAPEPKDQINFRIPGSESFRLTNGLEVFFIQKTDLPLIRLSFIINSGSKFDPVNKKGLSNLVSLCIDEGAGNLNALQIAEEFDQKGASFSIHTNNDITTLSLLVLEELFEDTIKILSDIIQAPHFNESDFERERRKVVSRILQLKDDPDYLASSSFEYLLFGKDNCYAFPTIGLPEDLKHLDLPNIRKMYSDFFSPSNSVMVAAGSIESKKLNLLLEKYFGSWQKSLGDVSGSNTGTQKKSNLFVIDKKNSVQTEIRIGQITPKRNQEDYFKRLLLNNILGGQFSSRINLNLREKHGYTYGAYSAFNYYKDDAFFYVSTSVGIDNTADALNQLYHELNKIREGITEDELSFAKSSIIKKFPSNFETYGQVVSNLVNKIVFNLPDNYLESYIDNVNRVSSDEVNEVAKLFIQPENFLTVLVGDKQSLKNQITKSNFRNVEYLDYEELFKR